MCSHKAPEIAFLSMSRTGFHFQFPKVAKPNLLLCLMQQKNNTWLHIHLGFLKKYLVPPWITHHDFSNSEKENRSMHISLFVHLLEGIKCQWLGWCRYKRSLARAISAFILTHSEKRNRSILWLVFLIQEQL